MTLAIYSVVYSASDRRKYEKRFSVKRSAKARLTIEFWSAIWNITEKNRDFKNRNKFTILFNNFQKIEPGGERENFCFEKP